MYFALAIVRRRLEDLALAVASLVASAPSSDADSPVEIASSSSE